MMAVSDEESVPMMDYKRSHDSKAESPRQSYDKRQLQDLERRASIGSSATCLSTVGQTLPDKGASPETVRNFLTDVLMTSRHMPIEQAQATAASWSIGTGRELAVYPPNMYLSIFGAEHGWALYKEVYVRRHREKRAKEGVKVPAICGSVLIVMLLLEAWIIHTLMIVGDGLWVLALLACSMGLLMAIGFFIIAVTHHRANPEDMAEANLQEAMSKTQNGAH